MLFAEAGGLDWNLVVTVFGTCCTAICAFLTVQQRNKGAAYETQLASLRAEATDSKARIVILEAEIKQYKIELHDEKAKHVKEVAVLTEIVETEWPSDDFSHQELVTRVREVAASQGFKVPLRIVSAMIKRIKQQRDSGLKPSIDGGEFFQ